MKKAVLLSGDTKVLKEICQWLGELGGQMRVDAYEDVGEFLRAVLSTESTDDQVRGVEPGAVGPGSAGPLETGSAQKIVDMEMIGAGGAGIRPDLLILDVESLPDDGLTWIIETRKQLDQIDGADLEQPVRVILMAYGETDFDIDRFRSEQIDDLVLKPLDKALFLQKVVLQMAKDESNIPTTYLYKQKTQIPIEMGKDSWIEMVSEFGFAIRNPAPLANGVFARIYSRLFGDGVSAGLIGRVYLSERHPSEANAYICYLSFYGISQAQLSTVRRFIRRERDANPGSSSMFRPYKEVMKTVVVIDMNPEARELIRTTLLNNFMNVTVHEFPSYSAFGRFCARRETASQAEANNEKNSSPADVSKSDEKVRGPAFADPGEISFLIETGLNELRSMDPMPMEGARILGVEAEDLIDGTQRWLDLFSADSKEEIEEFLVFLRSGQPGQLNVTAEPNPGESPVPIQIRGYLERSGESDGVAIARLTLSEIKDGESPEAGAQGGASPLDKLRNIDALYIDGMLLGEDGATSVNGLFEMLKRARLISTHESVVLTIMSDEKAPKQALHFRVKGISDFLCKPLDRKLILEKSWLLLSDLFLKLQNQNIDLSYYHAGMKGRITKDVLMEELSEFGLQVRHETALREKTFLRFFSPIFLREKGDGVLGRCIQSKKDTDSGLYHCFFAFFGVSDAQLKHIRNWIRGDYAASKNKKSS